MSTVHPFIQATRELAEGLNRLKFKSPVGFVYNPLDYAWAAHEEYLRKYCRRQQRVLFLGMNPGPFGMAQTGVPFGEVAAVRDWLRINARVQRPPREHPRKPVLGFDCPRSEVSGRRLWGLFARRFRTPRRFFSEHFVYNYSPLLFLDGGATGRNLTPENLPGESLRAMECLCDQHLIRLAEFCGAEWLVGVGNFAERRLKAVFPEGGRKVGKILHPSPASPAANRNWEGAVEQELARLGVWGDEA
jgi:single-strand selective monofunctional uracil DNA glycosylase